MGGDVSDLSVYNATGQSIEVSLEVIRVADEAVVLDETFALAAENDEEYPHPFSEDGSKRISVTVDGTRHASAEWDEDAAPDSSGLSVSVSEDEISINQVVA